MVHRISQSERGEGVSDADYMDYIDHTLLLSHKSLCEALELAGFEVMECIPQFLITARKP